LLAIQVISQIRSTFQIELPLRILFTAPRVADLADQVENLSWIIESLMKSGLGDSEEGREEGRL
jgi:hypothetical protein